MRDLSSIDELVLLAVASLKGEGYGVTVQDFLSDEGETVSLGAVYSTLQRLDDQGLVECSWAPATGRRGGRRKRVYEITAGGREALVAAQERRSRLWRKAGLGPAVLPEPAHG